MAGVRMGIQRHVVLTGVPGVGKTTLVRGVCDQLTTRDIPLQGFLTEELRECGRRTGFDVVTLSGVRGTLARVGAGSRDGDRSNAPGARSRQAAGAVREFRVGQYVVDIPAFEKIALPVLKAREDWTGSRRGVYVIDEIGKMELGSRAFPGAVQMLLDEPRSVVIATIPVPKGRPLDLVEHVRQRRDVTVFTVTRENRDALLGEIVEVVTKAL